MFPAFAIEDDTNSGEEYLFEASCSLSTPPLSQTQTDLLKMAFEIASKIPNNPHIKDRSRTQESVVDACLQLGQASLACGYLAKIENWRRGSCCAEVAFFLAQRNCANDARKWIGLAKRISDSREDWRGDRIKSKIAKTLVLLGETEKAKELESKVDKSERGEVSKVLASYSEPVSFESQMDYLSQETATNDFDLTKNALETYVELFNRFYTDEAKRSLIVEKMKEAWTPLPVFLRIDLLIKLAEHALKHRDQTKALEIIDEGRKLVEEHQWRLEHRMPYAARLAELRYLSGEAQRACAEAEALFARFLDEGHLIVNIYRAETLIPLGKAFVVMGESTHAQTVFKRAVEEGTENPNSRPRAEDLSAICTSLALCDFEPDSALWARMHEIQAGLGHPW